MVFSELSHYFESGCGESSDHSAHFKRSLVIMIALQLVS